MGCQKEIAAQIREQKGHYVLALKGNQSGLQEDLQQLFEQAIDTDFAETPHDVYETSEIGHGRTDERTCHVLEIPQDHPQRAAWKDLRTFVALTSHRITAEAETWETRFYISSHPVRASCWPKRFAAIGASKIVNTGFSMWSSAKTPAASSTATVPPTSPPSAVWLSACSAEKPPTNAVPKQTAQFRRRFFIPPQSDSHGKILMCRPWHHPQLTNAPRRRGRRAIEEFQHVPFEFQDRLADGVGSHRVAEHLLSCRVMGSHALGWSVSLSSTRVTQPETAISACASGGELANLFQRPFGP